MNSKRVCVVVALAVILCFSMMFFVEQAAAQDSESKSAKKSDQSTASKKGVAESLETPTKVRRGPDGRVLVDEEDDGVTKLQMVIGFGSIFVMLAVVKFL